MESAKTTITVTQKAASEDWVEFSFSAVFQSEAPDLEDEESGGKALIALFESVYMAAQKACLDRLQQRLNAAARSKDGLASDLRDLSDRGHDLPSSLKSV